MTAIIPGSEGTIQSSSAEQVLLDCITLIKNLEKIPTKNPTNTNGVSCSFGLNTAIASISFQMPAKPTINDIGQQVQTPTNYLSNTGFIPGTGGTFKSSSIEGYLLEVITYLEIMEANATKNPNAQNYISSSFDSDNRVVTGVITLPIVFELGSEFIKIMADEYLLD
jgi:hypothetical protein